MVFRMNYIMIPANIAYFVLGFISCFALIITYAIIATKKEMKKREALTNKVLNSLKKDDDK